MVGSVPENDTFQNKINDIANQNVFLLRPSKSLKVTFFLSTRNRCSPKKKELENFSEKKPKMRFSSILYGFSTTERKYQMYFTYSTSEFAGNILTGTSLSILLFSALQHRGQRMKNDEIGVVYYARSDGEQEL